MPVLLQLQLSWCSKRPMMWGHQLPARLQLQPGAPAVPGHLQPAEYWAVGSSTARGACCTRPAAVRTAGAGWGNRLVLGAGAVQEMRP